MKHKKPYEKNVYRSLVLISQFGINMLVPICLMSYIGIKLDKYFETSYIMIIFFFLGAIAGFQNIYRMSKQIFNDKNKDAEKKDEINK